MCRRTRLTLSTEPLNSFQRPSRDAKSALDVGSGKSVRIRVIEVTTIQFHFEQQPPIVRWKLMPRAGPSYIGDVRSF